MSSNQSGQRLRKHRPDYAMVLITSLLLILGIVVVYTISPALEQSAVVYRQLSHIALAALGFLVAAFLPIEFWRKVHIPLAIIGIGASLLLLVEPLAIEVNGATRWLNLGFFSFQPSELLKFALIIYFAGLLSERVRTGRLNSQSDTLVPVLLITAGVGVIVAVLQKDLGTMVSVGAILATMLYISGMKLRLFSRFIGAMAGAGLLMAVLFPHRLARLSTFLDPSVDAEGAGYHISQALIAIGSGGWFGRGLGQSVSVFGYLPEAINDSIFAIIAEQFGFTGSLLVIFLYGALGVRLLRVIERAPNDYMKLLVAGIFGWLISHVVINVGAMLGLVPLTGITLPFLSFGGTSLLFITIALGLAFNVSRYTSLAYTVNEEKAHEKNMARRRRNRRPHLAPASSQFRT
jgi:cell division protein FtsW